MLWSQFQPKYVVVVIPCLLLTTHCTILQYYVCVSLVIQVNYITGSTYNKYGGEGGHKSVEKEGSVSLFNVSLVE